MIKIKTFILYLIRVFFIIISIYESYIRENEKYNFYLYYFDYFLGVVGFFALGYVASKKPEIMEEVSQKFKNPN